jgi:hypothetical protein
MPVARGSFTRPIPAARSSSYCAALPRPPDFNGAADPASALPPPLSVLDIGSKGHLTRALAAATVMSVQAVVAECQLFIALAAYAFFEFLAPARVCGDRSTLRSVIRGNERTTLQRSSSAFKRRTALRDRLSTQRVEERACSGFDLSVSLRHRSRFEMSAQAPNGSTVLSNTFSVREKGAAPC